MGSQARHAAPALFRGVRPPEKLYNPSTLVRLSVMYPAAPGTTFDWNYYIGPHLAMAHRLLVPMGLIRIELDRGVMAFPPGTPSHFHAVGHLFFDGMEELQRALATHAPALVADQRRYFSGESIVQVSEVLELNSPGR